MERDERIVIERARQGDRSAFQQIFERYKWQIYNVSMDFTGNHHDAEDILQEVLIKTYRSLKGFRGDSQLSSWIHRITINTCIDQQRRSSRQERSAGDFPDFAEKFIEHSPQANPEHQSEMVRLGRHIDDAVQNLTPLERSVFVLRHYNHLPLKEVARILDRSEGTVKNMLWRALRKLRRELSAFRSELGLEASK